MPLLSRLNEKVNEEFLFDNEIVQIIEAEVGTENTAMQVDTKIVVLVKNEKIVIRKLSQISVKS